MILEAIAAMIVGLKMKNNEQFALMANLQIKESRRKRGLRNLSSQGDLWREGRARNFLTCSFIGAILY